MEFVMGKIPMQQWYPDAHIADTAGLTLEEQGAYRLLMDHMWIKGGKLKDNDKELARLLRISVKKWQKLKPKLADYLLFDEGKITQKRLQKDYKRACEISKKNAENGKVGGRKTAEKWQSGEATALANNRGFAYAKQRRGGGFRQIGDVLDDGFL